MLLGKWAAKPIVELSVTAKTIGEGRLDTHVEVPSKDEIGSLAKSLNLMATNLKDTMTSRDNLVSEVKQRKKAEEEREKLIAELQNALDDVNTLSGLLPICASCKKIRDDKGYWNQIEVYISDRSEADFSHGICPECAKKLYPELKLPTE